MADKPICSKCEADLDTNGFPRWCRKCRLAYKREYQALKAEMAETRGFAGGIEAMRTFLAERFEVYKIQRFSGPEIADVIRRCEAPKAGEASLASQAAS